MKQKTTYQQLLDDPRWRGRRLEIICRANFTCEECGYQTADSAELNAHHRYYRAGAKPWEYEDSELVCLCRSCHADMTDELERVYRAVGRLSISDLPRVVAFAESIGRDPLAVIEARQLGRG